MSLSGITGFSPDVIRPHIDSHNTPADARRESTVGKSATTPAPTAAARSGVRSTTRDSQVEAPEGTDPDLWSILTREERAFFTRTSGTGPLTYAKVMRPERHAAPASPTARGGRVDVRV